MRETTINTNREKLDQKTRFPRLKAMKEGLIKTVCAGAVCLSLAIAPSSAFAKPDTSCKQLGSKNSVSSLVTEIRTGDEKAVKKAATQFNPIIDCLLTDTTKISARAVNRIINNVRSLLKSKDDELKMKGLVAMAQIKEQDDLLRDNLPSASLPENEALSAIIKLLDSKDEAVRAFAVKLAVELSTVFMKPDSGEPKGLFRKLETLLDDEALGVPALDALDSYGYDYRNEQILKKVIERGNPRMSSKALDMLFARNSDPPNHSVIPYFVTLLGNPNENVRDGSRKALSDGHFWQYAWQFNQPDIGKTKSELTALTNHKNEKVRKAAAAILGNKNGMRLDLGN